MLSPVTVPGVVFALGAYLTFARVGLVNTEVGIILARMVLIFPVVYPIAATTCSSISPQLSLAATSLGASPWRGFRIVVFPLLLPDLGVGALLAMLLPFDESVASTFLSSLSMKILPRKLWEGIRFSPSPRVRSRVRHPPCHHLPRRRPRHRPRPVPAETPSSPNPNLRAIDCVEQLLVPHAEP